MRIRSIIAAAGLALCAGCGPSDPMDTIVDAKDDFAFSMWRSQALRSLLPEQMADFDESIREIKFHVMAEGSASGSDAITAATLDQVNHRTVRNVIEIGMGWELARLRGERGVLSVAVDGNARTPTRPGDTRSKRYLSELMDRQVARLNDTIRDIARIEGRMREDGLSPEPEAQGIQAQPTSLPDSEPPALLSTEPKRA